MMRRPVPRCFALLPALLCLAVLPGSAQEKADEAHASPPERVKTRQLGKAKVTLELKEASLRAGLMKLMETAPTDYLFALNTPEKGRITFSVKDVPFEGALVCVLRSVETAPVLVYEDMGGILFVGPDRNSPGGPVSGGKIWLDWKDVNIRFGLKALFVSQGINYVLDPKVGEGRVTLKLEGLAFRPALESVLVTSPQRLTYRVESGVYIIAPEP